MTRSRWLLPVLDSLSPSLSLPPYSYAAAFPYRGGLSSGGQQEESEST